MSAAAIGGAAGAAVQAADNNAFAAIGSSDFIRILVSELSNQDPLDPQDSSALLEQLSSIRNIESQLSLQEQLQDLVLQNQIALAGSLIGRVVAGQDDANRAVGGQVMSVRVEGGATVLELDSGALLPMSGLLRVEGAGATGSAPPVDNV